MFTQLSWYVNSHWLHLLQLFCLYKRMFLAMLDFQTSKRACLNRSIERSRLDGLGNMQLPDGNGQLIWNLWINKCILHYAWPGLCLNSWFSSCDEELLYNVLCTNCLYNVLGKASDTRCREKCVSYNILWWTCLLFFNLAIIDPQAYWFPAQDRSLEEIRILWDFILHRYLGNMLPSPNHVSNDAISTFA